MAPLDVIVMIGLDMKRKLGMWNLKSGFALFAERVLGGFMTIKMRVLVDKGDKS